MQPAIGALGQAGGSIMNELYILAIDCGTQSLRAIIFDKEGNAVATEKVEFEPYYSVNPGWAEQDSEVYWESVCVACRNLERKHPEAWAKVGGIVITTMRDTVVNIDKEGRVLRPVILWLDQRKAQCSRPLPLHDRILFKVAGKQKAAELARARSRANWIKENQPEIWDKTYKYIQLSGYFILKLTGKIIDSSASQIGHIPIDYKNRSWPKSKGNFRWSLFGVEREKLTDIVEPGSIIGGVTREASEATGLRTGLPVIAGASDKGCETLGVGCITPDCANISFGTTATVQVTSKKYFEPLRFMPAYMAAIPGHFNPEVQIYRGYWMISWFKKHFAAEEEIEAEKRGLSVEAVLNEKLKCVPAGCDGLILQPYWNAGLDTPDARGAIIGFKDLHTRIHIYRSIIEGINYALMEGMEKIEKKSGRKIKNIMVSGGGSQSDIICQITSDMFNLPVHRIQTYETSGLGAAIIGFIGLGIYKTFEEAIEKMVHYKDTFMPDKENAQIYNKLYKKAYKRLYPNIRGLYREINKIMQ